MRLGYYLHYHGSSFIFFFLSIFSSLAFSMATENFRFYLKVRTALRTSARVIYDTLTSVYGDEAPGLSTIERWSKLFRDSREEVEDKPRPSRPISETTTENIEQIRLIINDDSHITVKDI